MRIERISVNQYLRHVSGYKKLKIILLSKVYFSFSNVLNSSSHYQRRDGE